MRIVVKFAGALLERPSEESYRALAKQVAELAGRGHEVLVFHGGGRTFTATLARLGIESRFVDGLRVTDRETRDVAVMVLGGALNKQLAGAISAAGQPAVGISGADAACFTARPLEYPAGLGFVGEITAVNVGFFSAMWAAGIVPVCSCIGMGIDGELYNVNADQMAAAAAALLGADKLIFLTDVAGVLDGGEVLAEVDPMVVAELAESGKVTGGMVVKLDACKRALDAGVSEVRITGGRLDGGLEAAIAGEPVGTRVLNHVPVEVA